MARREPVFAHLIHWKQVRGQGDTEGLCNEDMALYDYKCHLCGKVFEVRQKFADPLLTVHESCGGELERLISAPALRFKGTGFYATDYPHNGNSPSPNGSHEKPDGKSESASDSKNESKSENKPENKPDSKPAPAPASTSPATEK